MKHGRQDPSDLEARKSADHPSEQSANDEETRRSPLEDTRRKHFEENHRVKYKETCRGNVDCRIQGIPHSAVQKEDSNCKETVKRLIQQFENHPICDSLNEDLNKIEEFNPFSEQSKELITSMGNTDYFELCEIFSKIPCLDCALHWEVGIVSCTCGKCMQPSERDRQLNKERYDVLSIPGCVIKKESFPRSQTWNINAQCM